MSASPQIRAKVLTVDNAGFAAIVQSQLEEGVWVNNTDTNVLWLSQRVAGVMTLRSLSTVIAAFDFTAGVMPAGLTYTRPLVGGVLATVQTGDGVIETGYAANVPRFGKEASTRATALLFERPTTNYLATYASGPSDQTGWARNGGGTVVFPYVGILSPDGVTSASEVTAVSGNFDAYATPGGLGAAVARVGSAWIRKPTAGSGLYCLHLSSGTVLGWSQPSDPGGVYPGGTAPAAWRRAWQADAAAAFGYFMIVEGRGNLAPNPPGLVASNLDVLAALCQLEDGFSPSSFINGGRGAERLQIPAVETVLSAGRLTISIRVRQTAASANCFGVQTLWFFDANNKATYSPTTQRVTITVGGVAWSPLQPLLWQLGDTVDFCVVVGNGPSHLYWQLNDGGGIDLGFAPTSAAALTWTGAFDLLQAANVNQFDGWYENIKIWRTGLPAWATPDSYAILAPDYNQSGRDWNSHVQGDFTTTDWGALYSQATTSAYVTSTIGTPDGGVQTRVLYLNTDGGATGLGKRGYRWCASATGAATASLVARLPPAVVSGSLTLTFADAAGTVLQTTVCALAATDTPFTVATPVTEGTEYQLIVGCNWIAQGGTAQCKAYCSKVTVSLTNEYGVYAQQFVRVDYGPGIIWEDDGQLTTGPGEYYWSAFSGHWHAVAECTTRQVAGEHYATVSAGTDDVGFFTGPSGGVPTTFRYRSNQTAAQLMIFRGAGPAGAKRITMRSGFNSPPRALYVPAASDLVVTTAAPAGNVLTTYGDSIMAGFGLANANAFPAIYCPRDAWIDQFRSVFPGAVKVQATGGHSFEVDGYVAAGGVISMTAGNISLRAKTMARFAALGMTHFLSNMGQNDTMIASDFAVAMGLFMDELHARFPNVISYWIGPGPRSTYDAVIASTVAARAGWTHPPIAGIFSDITAGSNPDGVHPDQPRSDAYFARTRTVTGF